MDNIVVNVSDTVQNVAVTVSAGGSFWGSITGTLSNQTDLQSALNSKQATLVSGSNIKTINGNSLLGSGDLSITASAAWGSITGTLSSQTDLQTALNGKWSLASGGTLTGANTIVGSGTNTIKFQFDSLAITPVNGAGLWLANTQVALFNNQQISPSVVWEGQGWQTNTSGSQSVKFKADVLPVQGAANPTGTWALAASINGAAYTNYLTLTNSGVLTLVGGSATTFNIDSTGDSGISFYRSGVFKTSLNYDSSNDGWSFYSAGAKMFIWRLSGDVAIGSTTDNARLYVNQAALSSAWKPTFRIDPGAHTAMTGEQTDFTLSSVTQTWAASSTIATQRGTYFAGKVLTGASGTAPAFTDVFNVYVDAVTTSASGGSTPTITRNWALGLAGSSIINSPSANQGYFITTLLGTNGIFGMRIAASGFQVGHLGGGGGNGQLIDFMDNAANTTMGRMIGGGPTLSAFAWNSTTTTNAYFYITSGAASSSWKPALRVDGGAHIVITAGSEQPNIILNSASTDLSFNSGGSVGAGSLQKTWNDGGVTTQRDIYIRGIQYRKTTTSATFTNAYSLYIDSPSAGTGVTITNNYALGVNGASWFGGDIRIYGSSGTLFNTIKGYSSGFGIIVDITDGGATGGVLIRNSAGDTTSTNVLTLGTSSVNNYFNPQSGSTARFIMRSTTGFTPAAAYTGNFYAFNWSGTSTVSVAYTGSITALNISPTYNHSSGTTTIYGIDYNPALTSMTGVTHYAARFTSGAVLIGGTSLTTAGDILNVQGGVSEFAATTTSYASIRLPHGTAPTSPVNGDMWTTTAGVFARINGSTVGPFSSGGGSGAAITNQAVTTSSTLPTAANKLYTIFVDATAGNIVITLPVGDTTTMHVIKRIDSTTNTVTFSGTIDGNSSYLGTTGLLPLNSFTLIYNGTSFYAI